MNEKKLFCSLFFSMGCLGLSAAHSAEPGNIRIGFVQPEKFSDFRIQGRQENVSAVIFRREISAYLSPFVTKRFPGAVLTLNFTDIDLAGRIDGSKNRKLPNARIDRNVASPLRLYFDYALADSQKRILASGSKSLVDADYLYRYNYYPDQTKSDPLFYEKAALNRWLAALLISDPSVTKKQNGVQLGRNPPWSDGSCVEVLKFFFQLKIEGATKGIDGRRIVSNRNVSKRWFDIPNVGDPKS